jgi:hypothetical protein
MTVTCGGGGGGAGAGSLAQADSASPTREAANVHRVFVVQAIMGSSILIARRRAPPYQSVQQYRSAPLPGLGRLQTRVGSASSGRSEPVHENPNEVPAQPCTLWSGAQLVELKVTQQNSVAPGAGVPSLHASDGSAGTVPPVHEKPVELPVQPPTDGSCAQPPPTAAAGGGGGLLVVTEQPVAISEAARAGIARQEGPRGRFMARTSDPDARKHRARSARSRAARLSAPATAARQCPAEHFMRHIRSPLQPASQELPPAFFGGVAGAEPVSPPGFAAVGVAGLAAAGPAGGW